MTRPHRRRARLLLIVSLLGFTVAALGFFATGLVLAGLMATVAGLATVATAGRHARPANWSPEDCDRESR